MSVTVDVNVLLYAVDSSSPHHSRNVQVLEHLAVGPELLYLFWPSIVAFLRIATHPAIFREPLEPDVARANVEELVSRPNVRTPGEQPSFWRTLRDVLEEDVVRGNLVGDAYLVALMRHHDVDTIWTSDRDFRRFDRIRVRDPSTAVLG